MPMLRRQDQAPGQSLILPPGFSTRSAPRAQVIACLTRFGALAHGLAMRRPVAPVHAALTHGFHALGHGLAALGVGHAARSALLLFRLIIPGPGLAGRSFVLFLF